MLPNTSDCEPGARNVVALGTEGHLRSIGVATVSAWVAHAFAWAAGVFFAFGPVYQGESVTPALPGETGGEVIRSSATAIEVNGLHVILLLLVPILLTAIHFVGPSAPTDDDAQDTPLEPHRRASGILFCSDSFDRHVLPANSPSRSLLQPLLISEVRKAMSRSSLSVVTGAFGYSGKYIARRLLEQGATVKTLTRTPTSHSPFGDRVEALPLDFGDFNGLVENLRGAATLYNTYWIRFARGTVMTCPQGLYHQLC